MEFTITSTQILGLCTFISSIWGIYKIIKELKKPSDDLKSKVEEHDRKLNDDFQKLNELELQNKLILQSLLVIIDHDITNNGYPQLEEARDNLQEYLINK